MTLPATYIQALERLSLAFGVYESETGSPPILVGGAAAAIRTGGQFMSADLDVVAETKRLFPRLARPASWPSRGPAKPSSPTYHPKFPAYAVDRVSGAYFDGRGDRHGCCGWSCAIMRPSSFPRWRI